MQPRQLPRGIYVSYDEERHGSVAEAVTISNQRGYLIWLDRNALDPHSRSLLFPATIVIRIKGVERYYRGKLLAIHRRSEVDAERLLSETVHRPPRWQHADRREEYADFQSVLYIEGLAETAQKPGEIEGMRPPEHPSYF
jgi:hypothetical protein